MAPSQKSRRFLLLAVLFLAALPLAAQPADFGDAPDGGATGYPNGAPGQFPSLSTSGHCRFGTTAIHTLGTPIFFGSGATRELEALIPDLDSDDAWSPGMPPMLEVVTQGVLVQGTPFAAQLSLPITNLNASGTFYLNVLVDRDQNGAFRNTTDALGNPVFEWVVQDQPVVLPAGNSEIVTTPAFAYGIGISAPLDVWVRLALTREPVQSNLGIPPATSVYGGQNPPLQQLFDEGWDGCGQASAGEVEDWLLHLPGSAAAPAPGGGPAAPPPGLPNLAVTKTAIPNPVQVGHDLAYTVTVTNDGSDEAKDVFLADFLPPGVFLADFAPQPECTAGGRLVLCDFGDLAPGDSHTLTLTVRPMRCGVVRNLALAFSLSPESEVSDNLAATDTTVQGCLLVARTQLDGNLQVRAGNGDATLNSSQQVGTQAPQLKRAQARAQTLRGNGVSLQMLTEAVHPQLTDLKAGGDYRGALLVQGTDPPGTPVAGLQLTIAPEGFLRTLKLSDFGMQTFDTRFVLEVSVQGITNPAVDEFFICGATLSPDQALAFNPGTGATVKCRPGDFQTSVSTTFLPNDTRHVLISKQGANAFRLPLAPVAVGDTLAITVFFACGTTVPADAGEGLCEFFNTLDLGAIAEQPGTGLLFSPADADTCPADSENLCLGDDRFRFDVTWQDTGGASGTGTAVPLTGDTGYFWFSNPNTVDLAIRVVDEGQRGSRFRLYNGSLTDVEYTLTVTDTVTGSHRTYANPRQRSGDAAEAQARQILTAAMATCIPSPQHLCLRQQRFQLAATWRDIHGRTGHGQGTAITGDAGYFTFLDPNRIELVVKVLADGTVLHSALAHVEYTLTVTDTATGASTSYVNPLRRGDEAGSSHALPGP